MKKLYVLMLVLCGVAAEGADYYLRSSATDLTDPASYTMDFAGTQPATAVPGSDDEVHLLSGTYEIAGASASFATLSGVKRVRPENGAVMEFTIDENDTRTFEAPINYNGGYNYSDEANIKCYGKVVGLAQFPK